ncbi:TetR/AcrR family transcriptional regulator [Dinoroseobacter sp. S124A]|uniref:TetR/AcrR family transcriptional regulator n=1 Tax=Dinoroseobacter sp. S124A TaxID=3415128 RepID=UPI003C7BE149
MSRSSAPTINRILTAAFRLFFRRGYSRVSMDEIASEAGVTKRTLYNHFASKDALIGAVMDRQADLTLDTVRGWADPEAVTSHAFLDGLLVKLADWAGAPGWTGSGFTRLTLELADLPGHPVRAAADRHKRAVQDWIAAELAARHHARPARAAETFCILLEGALVLTLIHGDPGYIMRLRSEVPRLTDA